MKRREIIKGTALSIFAALVDRVPDVQAKSFDDLVVLSPDHIDPVAPLENGETVWELEFSFQERKVRDGDGKVVATWVDPNVRTILTKHYRTDRLDPDPFANIGRIVPVKPPGFPDLAPGRDWLGIGPRINQLGDESRFRWEVRENFQLSPEGGWGPLYETGFLDTRLAEPWKGDE